MTPRVDIGREACERIASSFRDVGVSLRACRDADAGDNADYAAALVLALRDALDAAERDRNSAIREIGNTAREATAAADATGYARGVRDAAACCKRRVAELGGRHSRPAARHREGDER